MPEFTPLVYPDEFDTCSMDLDTGQFLSCSVSTADWYFGLVSWHINHCGLFKTNPAYTYMY